MNKQVILMRKRFLWSIILSLAVMIGVAPINYFTVANVDNIREASNRNFITILTVEIMVIFGVTFNVVNQYFIMHPDYDTIMFLHKQKHPDIPEKYYKDDELNTQTEEQKDKDQL